MLLLLLLKGRYMIMLVLLDDVAVSLFDCVTHCARCAAC